VPASGDGIKLVSDKSGNSAVNALALNGVAGNYASAPDSVPLSITGDIDIRAHVALDDWTPGTSMMLLAKDTSGQRSYTFSVLATTGLLVVGYSTDGTNLVEITSSVAPTVSDFGRLWVRVTLDVDNGAGGKTATFYTSTDGSIWTQLGTAQTTAGTIAIADTTSVLQIGSNFLTSNRLTGLVYRAQIYNGIAGTLVFDANFSTASKLATSFTESSANAATVTINTTGATGARICGARDLYQGTAANQAALTIAASGNYLTNDGVNDYLKAAAFSLSQPTTVYFVGSQVSWTSGDYIYDGNAANTLSIDQHTATPNVNMAAPNHVADNAGWAVNTKAVLSAVFNGAASSLRVNLGTAATGDAGTSAANGFMLASLGGAANFSHITVSEILIYSGAHDFSTQNRVIDLLARRCKVAIV